MKTPPGLDKFLSSALVSLTLLGFAALMLVFPLYRLAIVHWPEPINEHVYPDGRVRLHESVPAFGDDGIVRSRPRNAARIEYTDGTRMLGYVVAVRPPGGKADPPPAGTVWQPITRQCELALMRPGGHVEWVPCARVVEVSKPNRMHPGTRARLAFARALPGLPKS